MTDNIFSNIKLPNGKGPYINCPGKGIDSRFLTNYNNTTNIYNSIKKNNNLADSFDMNDYINEYGKEILNALTENYKVQNCKINVCTNIYPTKITNEQMAEQMKEYNNKWYNNNNTNCTKYKWYPMN